MKNATSKSGGFELLYLIILWGVFWGLVTPILHNLGFIVAAQVCAWVFLSPIILIAVSMFIYLAVGLVSVIVPLLGFSRKE